MTLLLTVGLLSPARLHVEMRRPGFMALVSQLTLNG